MDKFLITGGRPLEGRVMISGAKNAALPAMAAALLTDQRVVLHNVPRVRDIGTLRMLLAELGVDSSAEREGHGHRVEIQARQLEDPLAPYELVKQMRASVLVLGPLVARAGHARVSLPGGCAIGARPINLHLKGLEALGASIQLEHGYVEAWSDGETVFENAAREPEVQDLADLLNAMGARIDGAGTATLRVRGVSKLHGAEHTIIPDRIETGTFMAAAAITGGRLLLDAVEPSHIATVTAQLAAAGVEIKPTGPRQLEVAGAGPLQAGDVVTQEYPGFPTDMQAQYMALMTQARGTSVITETIFENRFMHALELLRLGADITIDGRRALIRGGTPLSGANVQASDLRASASLVLAGLAARGETLIDRVYHIDRGYQRIEEKLTQVGASIRRISEAG